MALLNHIAAAPASLPPTEMDRIEALRAALERCAESDGNHDGWTARIVADALAADDRAAAAQDEAQQAESAPERVFGWSPSGLIRELPERPTDPMEPIL